MASLVRDRRRTSFRLAGFLSAVAIGLLLTVADAEGPLAKEEGTQPQDQKPYALTEDERPTFKPRALEDKEAAPDQLIVKFKKDAGSSSRAEARSAAGLEKKKDLNLIDAEVDKVKGQSVERAIEALKRRPDVQYAEPDYINYPSGYADEPQFGELWGLNNTGQKINGWTGTSDMDINSKEASAVTWGDQNLLVAVIDTGVDFSHPDLKDRAWKNPGESGSGKETNGVDDDANGKVDDVNGWDFYYDDKTVHDTGEDAHGTHVSGTLAASINGQGVVGVAPNIQVMSLKFLGPNGGYTSDAIDALGYAKSKGAKISNNSWGGGAFSQALKDAIEASNQLFVAAAGNSTSDNDTKPAYPASYDSPNILSVAAIDNQGKLAYFSNYGATSVDVSAPGASILSSIPGAPGPPAAALSTVESDESSDGKALTAGFGANEIGDGTKRASFMSKALTAVEHESEQVVLVDDDLSDLSDWGYPDVGADLSAAIQSATGSAPEEIDVSFESGGDGPDLSQLSGKTVVWATGQAWFSQHDSDYNITETTLTDTDQTTLTDFLNGGGKLVLTGMDALFGIENSPFVTSTLGLSVQSEVGVDANAKAFEGSWSTAFDGESYTFDSDTAYDLYHDKVEPAGSAAATQGVYPSDTPPSWRYYSGTSMAAPHATGVAALLASQSPSLLSNSQELKKVIMDKGKPVSTTAGKTVTGDMVDALTAVLSPDTTAPEVTAPDHSFQNYTLGTSTTNFVPVKLTWSGTDKPGDSGLASGIVSYQLQQSVDGGAYTDVTPSSASSTTTWLTPTKTYRFRVAAKDKAGNVSDWTEGPSFKINAYQESNPQIAYTGSWKTAALSGAYGGSVKHASASSKNATLATFTVPVGSKNVEWVTTMGSNRGKAEVWLDGTRVTTVDLYVAGSLPRSVLFSTPVDSTKNHKLEVRVLEQKNASSTGTRVDIDAFMTS